MRQLDIREKYFYKSIYTNTHKHMQIKYNSITEILINKKSTPTILMGIKVHHNYKIKAFIQESCN